MLLRLPMVGRFVLGVNSARFASTLAILLDAGVPLLRALEAARQTLGNASLARCADDVSARVREGAALGAALKVQKVYPPILVHLVASGERPVRWRRYWIALRRRSRARSSAVRWR